LRNGDHQALTKKEFSGVVKKSKGGPKRGKRRKFKQKQKEVAQKRERGWPGENEGTDSNGHSTGGRVKGKRPSKKMKRSRKVWAGWKVQGFPLKKGG